VTAIGIRFQQLGLAALAPLVAVLFWSRTADPVNVPKSTLAAVVAVLLVVVSVIRAAATRRLTVPVTASAWAAAAFATALLVATVSSDVPGASVAGTLGRSDGLILYGACVVLFLVGLRVFDAMAVRRLLMGVLLGGLFSVLYGLLQHFGGDPINWADIGLSPIIGAFGNPDFESGYLGIVVPVAAWGALSRVWPLAWRIASACLLVSCLVVAELSSSNQGVLAGGAGLVIVLVALLLERGGRWTRPGLLAIAAAALVVVALAAAGIAGGVGPGQRLTSAGSLTARKWYWGSAVEMWRQHPVTGVGLDRYGAYYRSVRPGSAAAANNYSDAAHSVPLHMLATGGLLLALSYLAVCLLVAWALVVGLRRLAGEVRLLVGGVGGAWVAYQVQALVSIDEPALAVTHWLLAAAVVATATPPRLYERLLPGAVQPRARKGRNAPAETAPPAVWSAASFTVCGLACVIGLVAMWLVLKPLRASYDARGAGLSLARGDGNAALRYFDAATRLAPYESAYWLQRGRFFEQVKQPVLAAASYASGFHHDPRSYDVLIAGARLAKTQQDTAALDRYTRQLAVVDPSGNWRARLGS
jgi:O-antigen ligase